MGGKKKIVAAAVAAADACATACAAVVAAAAVAAGTFGNCGSRPYLKLMNNNVHSAVDSVAEIQRSQRAR